MARTYKNAVVSTTTHTNTNQRTGEVNTIVSQRATVSKSRRQVTGANGQDVSFILRFVAVILLVANLFIALFGSGNYFTFDKLLNVFQDAPDVVAKVREVLQMDSWKIDTDWGVFNFLRDFINTFIDIANFALFISLGAVQVVVYIGYFIKYLF